METFDVDANGNLAIALSSSDKTYVKNTDSSSIALYWPSSSSNWLWAKELLDNYADPIIELKIRGSDSRRMALLSKDGVVIVLETINGEVVEAHKHSEMDCAAGCSILYPRNSLYLLGV